MYANSYRKCEGTHVSVHALRLGGINDNELNRPFVGLINIELLNQLTMIPKIFIYLQMIILKLDHL